MSVQGVIRPWEANPYQLISWWDMERFSAVVFYMVGLTLERVKTDFERPPLMGDPGFAFGRQIDSPLGDADRQVLTKLLHQIRDYCVPIGLRYSVHAIDRFLGLLANVGLTRQMVTSNIDELDRRIIDEMRSNLFMFIPPSRANYYDKFAAFGPDVQNKFPQLQFDAVEAGNCFAAGRFTACVFHLMRMAEAGVQELGTCLGVSLANQKNWQVILDEVNKAIRPLPKDPRTVALGEAAAHLFNVKLAWRNQVMHPKDTYTEEEAKSIFEALRAFLNILAKLI